MITLNAHLTETIDLWSSGLFDENTRSEIESLKITPKN